MIEHHLQDSGDRHRSILSRHPYPHVAISRSLGQATESATSPRDRLVQVMRLPRVSSLDGSTRITLRPPRCIIHGHRIHHGPIGIIIALTLVIHDRHDWRKWFNDIRGDKGRCTGK